MKNMKLKIWNKKEKKWCKNAILKGNKEIEVKKTINDLIFCPFTNLLDKTGKEIYGGDIVKDEYGLISDVDFFDNGDPCVYFDEEIGGEDLYSCNENCEIIGNIFENKELLEVNKK